MALIEVAEDIIADRQISPGAVRWHSAYLAGAQTEILDDLRSVMFIDGPQPTEPEDPENPAECAWRQGWSIHFESLKRKGLESTPERALGVLTAAGLVVMEKAHEVTGRYDHLQTPLLYKLYLPKVFGSIEPVAE